MLGSSRCKVGLGVVALAVVLGAAVQVPVAGAATGTISGSVFDDANRNRVRDAGEAPFPGRELRVHRMTGEYVGWVVTDSAGHYEVSGLSDGDYRVAMVPSGVESLWLDWVPTTSGTHLFQVLASSGAASADLGLRRIVRSTDVDAPISTFTGSDGLRVYSYNDAVSAARIHDELHTGTLLGPETALTKVFFDLGTTNVTNSTWSGEEGSYSGYSATINTDYLGWLATGNRVLFHEYGHAWSRYNEIIVQQTESLDRYLEARGLAGDPRVGTNSYWDPVEMVAEDFRQLFGSGRALTDVLANSEIPAAKDVPGLADWLRTAFTSPPGAGPTPPPPTSDPVTAPLALSDLAIEPRPVSDTGTVRFSLSGPAAVVVQILDSTGRSVRTLVDGTSVPAGMTTVVWDRRSDAGRKVRAGSYLVSVTATGGQGVTVSSDLAFTVVDPVKATRSRV